MKNKNNILFLLLLPYCHVAAQSSPGDEFMGNTGAFTPSTLIIIIIAVIFILTGFLAVFLRQFSQGCFGLNVVPTSAVTTEAAARGLDADLIKSLPTYLYSDVKQHRLGKVELECAVCLSEFQDPEALRLLPGCSHVFHPRCIDRWLASHVTCPICRQNLSRATTNKPNTMILNIIPLTDQNESDGQDQGRQLDDHHHPTADDDDGGKEMKWIVGKFPRSHSTGHSLADSDRFTLRLPAEVQNTLVNRCSQGGDQAAALDRCGWFPMTPPTVNSRSGLVRSRQPAGLIIHGSKNLPVKTSDCLWPI